MGRAFVFIRKLIALAACGVALVLWLGPRPGSASQHDDNTNWLYFQLATSPERSIREQHLNQEILDRLLLAAARLPDVAPCELRLPLAIDPLFGEFAVIVDHPSLARWVTCLRGVVRYLLQENIAEEDFEQKGIFDGYRSFDATDENGVRVTRTIEAYRDQNGVRKMRFASSDRALIRWTVASSFLIALCSSTGSVAFAEILPGAKCPPDFTCFSVEPRDGVCRHPAIVLDQQTKSTRYEGDPFSRGYEKACIAKTNSLVTRQGAELRLKLGNGAVNRYRDNQSKAVCENGPYTSCKKYVLYDYFPEHGLFLINVGYNENQEWLLVSQVDGKEQKVIAPPGYSPNKKWLVSVYATDGGDDGNNGIDIFPADLNPAKSSFHYRPEDYEQWEFAGWDGDDRLLLKVTERVGNNPELVTRPAEVVYTNGTWQLRRLRPASSQP